MYIDRSHTHVSSFRTISWLRQVRNLCPIPRLPRPPSRPSATPYSSLSTRVSDWLFFVERVVPAGAIRVFRSMYYAALTGTTYLQIVHLGVGVMLLRSAGLFFLDNPRTDFISAPNECVSQTPSLLRGIANERIVRFCNRFVFFVRLAVWHNWIVNYGYFLCIALRKSGRSLGFLEYVRNF